MSEKRLICIDPGHGGKYPGAVTTKSLEKDLNLELALSLRQVLLPDFAVVMTRRDDRELGGSSGSDLAMRCRICNDADADLFISVHHNSSFSPNPSGFEVLYWHSSARGKALAEAISRSFQPLAEKYGIKNRGAKPRRNFYVLRHTRPPAVLIEAGFITNPGEVEKMKQSDYRKELAEAVKTAVPA
jgi:N-acetylmuramoyl-L-alanine amidase